VDCAVGAAPLGEGLDVTTGAPDELPGAGEPLGAGLVEGWGVADAVAAGVLVGDDVALGIGIDGAGVVDGGDTGSVEAGTTTVRTAVARIRAEAATAFIPGTRRMAEIETAPGLMLETVNWAERRPLRSARIDGS